MDKLKSRDRIEHILNAIKHIQVFVSKVNEDDFVEDIKLQSAVQYQFLIIGEAVRYIDDSILVKYKYPWHIPRSFRNFIIHEYYGVKLKRIFYAAQDLEPLEIVMNQILKNEF